MCGIVCPLAIGITMSAVAPATSGTPVLPEDQLLELLAQLQRTTPEQARTILNAQPGIGFALFPLMVRVGIVDIEILQARPFPTV